MARELRLRPAQPAVRRLREERVHHVAGVRAGRGVAGRQARRVGRVGARVVEDDVDGHAARGDVRRPLMTGRHGVERRRRRRPGRAVGRVPHEHLRLATGQPTVPDHVHTGRVGCNGGCAREA